MTPARLFRVVAVAEAISWTLLLTGMVVRSLEITDVGVTVFGLVHGVVFIAYALTTVVVAVDQRWGPGRTVLGLAASIPPFATVLFDVLVERRPGAFGAWRLDAHPPTRLVDRPVAGLLRDPVRGAAVGVVVVVVLTALALLAGPPG